MPDGEQRRPAWVGALDRGDERGELRDPQTVFGDRLRVPDSDMPPAGAAYPFEHAELEGEARYGDSGLVWFLHGRDPAHGPHLPVREADGVGDVGQLTSRLGAQIVICGETFHRSGG